MTGGPAREAQLATFSLDPAGCDLTACRSLLSPDERARADRFVFPRDGQHYTLARAALRQTLGEVLGEAPDRLRFAYGAHGKPALGGAQAGSGLAFNLSHSGERALLGLAFGGQIGVDLECLRELSDRDALVRRFFSAAENEAYFDLPQALRQPAFFACWTRKEALVKALGQGLSFPLREFDVSLQPGQPAQLLRLREASGEASGWCLQGLDVGPGYAAAAALQGSSCQVLANT